MAEREKLIELLFVGQVLADAECDKQAECNKCQYKAPNACRVGFIADNLIANGVTIQRWIPVTERLPEDVRPVLCWNDRYCYSEILRFANCLEEVDEYDFHGERESGFYDYDSEWGYYQIEDVTHWMPLPEPPKGE